MFTLLHNLYTYCKGRGEKQVSILILGLDNAGKSTLLSALKGATDHFTTPTWGFSSELVAQGKTKITYFDLGGGERIRGIWPRYFSEVFAVIYVVDACDVARLEESRQALFQSIDDSRLASKPLLIVANKQDLPRAMSAEEVSQHLGLSQVRSSSYKIIPGIAKTPEGSPIDQSIAKGISWMMNNISSSFAAMNERVRRETAEQREKERLEAEERRKRVEKMREERRMQQELEEREELENQKQQQHHHHHHHQQQQQQQQQPASASGSDIESSFSASSSSSSSAASVSTRIAPPAPGILQDNGDTRKPHQSDATTGAFSASHDAMAMESPNREIAGDAEVSPVVIPTLVRRTSSSAILPARVSSVSSASRGYLPPVESHHLPEVGGTSSSASSLGTGKPEEGFITIDMGTPMRSKDLLADVSPLGPLGGASSLVVSRKLDMNGLLGGGASSAGLPGAALDVLSEPLASLSMAADSPVQPGAAPGSAAPGHFM